MNQNEEKKHAPVTTPTPIETPREKTGRVLPVPFVVGSKLTREKRDDRGGAR